MAAAAAAGPLPLQRLKNSGPRRANISRLGRSSKRVRAPPRRENDLRSRTYSESDLATRKRSGRVYSAALTVTCRILAKPSRVLVTSRDMIDPPEELRDYNPRARFVSGDEEMGNEMRNGSKYSPREIPVLKILGK